MTKLQRLYAGGSSMASSGAGCAHMTRLVAGLGRLSAFEQLGDLGLAAAAGVL
jgi:hypothetical protein